MEVDYVCTIYANSRLAASETVELRYSFGEIACCHLDLRYAPQKTLVLKDWSSGDESNNWHDWVTRTLT